MQDKYEVFLLVSEELNFTRAAEKYFVTQQTVSYHMNTLEKELNTKLFDRKPNLRLTDSGEVLYENLKKMKLIEESTIKLINEIEGENIGEIKIGINPVRARIMLSDFFEEYSTTFPKVVVNFLIADTRHLENMLVNNEVDMFVGVETRSNKIFNREKIYDENLYFIATKKFLKNNTKLTDEEIASSIKYGISLQDIDGIPAVMNLTGCSFNEIIEINLSKYNLILPNLIKTSDYDMQIHFCGKNVVGGFCPTLILYKVIEHNRLYKNNRILIFKIREIHEKLGVELVSSNLKTRTTYERIFIEKLLSESKNKYKDINNVIKKYFSSLR